MYKIVEEGCGGEYRRNGCRVLGVWVWVGCGWGGG